MRWQALDLFDVEDRVALHEGDRLIDLLAGLFISFGARERVSIDDGRALFAFPDMAAEFAGLLEGHPDRGAEVPFHRRSPERQDVDAAIGLSVVAQRAGDGSGGVRGVPGLCPGFDALLQGGDDLVGDAGVDVCAVRFGLSGHVFLLPFGVSSRRVPEGRADKTAGHRADRRVYGQHGPVEPKAETDGAGRPLTGRRARPMMRLKLEERLYGR